MDDKVKLLQLKHKQEVLKLQIQKHVLFKKLPTFPTNYLYSSFFKALL